MIYHGGCHCGAVRFDVEAPAHLDVSECNCSICRKTGFLHLIVPLSKFRLLSGKDSITTYTFNTGVAKHTFCSVCGIKPFYTPRSNPDGIDINVRCFDETPAMTVTQFDGVNWEQHAHTVAHLSKD